MIVSVLINTSVKKLNKVYDYLIKELTKDVTEKHYNLYNLIKLSYSNKR